MRAYLTNSEQLPVYSKKRPEKVSRLGFEPSLGPSPLSTRALTQDSN